MTQPSCAAAPRSILLVCLGNICRSPSAEGVLRAQADALGLALRIDSCGLGDWHRGAPPHAPAVRAAAARGYDISGLRARQIAVADFTRFDLILAMDRDNLAGIERLRPAGNATPARLFLDDVRGGPDEVPDPYYSGDFETALDLIEAGARGLLARIG